MKTTVIQKDEWSKFFDSFSRRQNGSSATLEILGAEIGAQVEEHDLAFKGIVGESNRVQGYEIAIMMGTRQDDHVTHSISRLTKVSIEQTDEGTDLALELKSADGVTALLRFRSPSLEMMDAAAGQLAPSV
jgi:hypothetical protein